MDGGSKRNLSNHWHRLCEPFFACRCVGFGRSKACADCRVSEVEQLLQSPLDPNIRDSLGKRTALHVAAGNGHSEVVELLLEAGADKDAVMQNGRTVFDVAVSNDHLEVVRVLLNAGAEKDAPLQNGVTALYAAASYDQSRLVKLLLEAGAKRNAVMQNGKTALDVAVSNGHREVVKLLLEASAEKGAVSDKEVDRMLRASTGKDATQQLMEECVIS